MADSFAWESTALWGEMELLTKSSAEKLSRFLCPDYDGIAKKHPLFKTFKRGAFQKIDFVNSSEMFQSEVSKKTFKLENGRGIL